MIDGSVRTMEGVGREGGRAGFKNREGTNSTDIKVRRKHQDNTEQKAKAKH